MIDGGDGGGNFKRRTGFSVADFTGCGCGRGFVAAIARS
jgi:hypothetical protein